MNNRINNDAEIMEELKNRLGAEPELYQPDEEELRFIEERDRLGEEMQCSFEKYTQYYELIRAYGLDLKLINELEWFIVIELEHNREEFIRSPFYQKFKDHEVVKRAYSEYKRLMELRR